MKKITGIFDKVDFQQRGYWLIGKFVIGIELILYFWSIKCMIFEIIPFRIENSILDTLSTSVLLIGYILTLRSLFLGSLIECGTKLTQENCASEIQVAVWQQYKREENLLKKKIVQFNKSLAEILDSQNKKKKCQCLRRKKKQEVSQLSIQELKSEIQNAIKELNLLRKSREGQEEVCIKCQLIRKHQEHHCSMCNKCVPRMDHHCFFLGQCVGQHNYSYFLSYVALSILMTGINLLALIFEVYYLFTFKWELMSIGIFETFILFLSAALFFIFTVVLFISHLYYISNEITFLEKMKEFKQEQYSPLQWICIVLTCKFKQKLATKFSSRWQEIFNSQSVFAILFPEPLKQSEEQKKQN